MSENLLTKTADGVLHLTLNRPEKKNALTLAMYEGLTDALDGAVGDPDVRVVLLSGAGGAFTAGNDLFDFLNDPPKDETSPVFRFLRAVSTFPKPLVAAVEGHAIGIGTTVLLHCDLAYAAPSARFQLPFVNLGLVPEAASSLLLPKTVGTKKAAELLLFGDPFSANDALAAGLINAVVQKGSVADYALERAQALARKPPASLRLTKALLRSVDADAVSRTIVDEGAHFMRALTGPEAQEALGAFLEKREPDFSQFD